MSSTWLLVALAAALLLAVGLAAYMIGRLVLGVSRYYVKERQRPHQITHAELGKLVYDSGLWSGKLHLGGRSIPFHVAGTEAGPDPSLLDQLPRKPETFGEWEQAAKDFIGLKEPKLKREYLEFYSLDFLWDDRPQAFALEFTLAGDVDGVWRVEFVDGRPQSVGRDD